MSTAPDIVAVHASIERTVKLIERHRALISERNALGKPAEALRPMLQQIESNLAVLHRMQAFAEAREKRLPAIRWTARPRVPPAGGSAHPARAD